LIPKLTGTKIFLDIHDIVPEFYSAKFNVSKRTAIFRILLFAEKIATTFADHVIISNELWRKKICSRSVKSNKCTAIINYPDEEIFYPNKVQNNGKFVFLYPGTLNYHQGLDLAIMAINKIKSDIPNIELKIVGDGSSRDELQKMIHRLKLENFVKIMEPVTLEEVSGLMSSADAGIIPKRNDEFGGEAFSTKTLEFMLTQVPIILSRTKIDQYYFNKSVVKFFEPEDIDDLSKAMMMIATDENLRCKLIANASEFARLNSWGNNKRVYLELVDRLNSITSY
jgi:glycosyltransferase involved in cell wall biosynthesis